MAAVADCGQAYERDAVVGVVGRGGPAEYLSVSRRAHRHVDRPGRPVVDQLEQQFGPPAGHDDVRVDEFLVGGRRIAVPAARARGPVQLDGFVVVGAHLERVVRRRTAGASETQRDAPVDARRPTLERYPQARRVPPLGQHVQPVHRAAAAAAAQQQRFRIAARTVGHVAQVVAAAVHVTPRARRLLRRITAVIGPRVGRSVRKNKFLVVVLHRALTAV